MSYALAVTTHSNFNPKAPPVAFLTTRSALANLLPSVFRIMSRDGWRWIESLFSLHRSLNGAEAGILAEQLLNNRLQMRVFGATEKVVTLTKQTKMGLCEQVRVN
jgi:hypothetical protein